MKGYDDVTGQELMNEIIKNPDILDRNCIFDFINEAYRQDNLNSRNYITIREIDEQIDSRCDDLASESDSQLPQGMCTKCILKVIKHFDDEDIFILPE